LNKELSGVSGQLSNAAGAVKVRWSPEDDMQNSRTGRALIFTKSDQVYGVAIDFVKKIIELPAMISVGRQSPWHLGLMIHDSELLPLIDVHEYLAHADSETATVPTDVACDGSPQQPAAAIVIDCGYGKVLLAADKIRSLVDLDKHPRHPAGLTLLECVSTVADEQHRVVSVVALFESFRQSAGPSGHTRHDITVAG